MTETITISREEWETIQAQFQLIANVADDDTVEATCNAGLEFMAEVEHPDEVEPEPDAKPEGHKGQHATCDTGGFWVLVPNPGPDDYVKCNKCGETCPF